MRVLLPILIHVLRISVHYTQARADYLNNININNNIRFDGLNNYQESCDDTGKSRTIECVKAVREFCNRNHSYRIIGGVTQEVGNGVFGVECFRIREFGTLDYVTLSELKSMERGCDHKDKFLAEDCATAARRWCVKWGSGEIGLVQDTKGSDSVGIACINVHEENYVEISELKNLHSGCGSDRLSQAGECVAASHRWCENRGYDAGWAFESSSTHYMVACFDTMWSGDVNVIAPPRPPQPPPTLPPRLPPPTLPPRPQPPGGINKPNNNIEVDPGACNDFIGGGGQEAPSAIFLALYCSWIVLGFIAWTFTLLSTASETEANGESAKAATTTTRQDSDVSPKGEPTDEETPVAVIEKAEAVNSETQEVSESPTVDSESIVTATTEEAVNCACDYAIFEVILYDLALSWINGFLDVNVVMYAWCWMLLSVAQGGMASPKAGFLLMIVMAAFAWWWILDKLLPLIRMCSKKLYYKYLSTDVGSTDCSCKCLFHPKIAIVMNLLYSDIAFTIITFTVGDFALWFKLVKIFQAIFDCCRGLKKILVDFKRAEEFKNSEDS